MCWISLNVAYLLKVHILAWRSGLDSQEIALLWQVEVQGGKWQGNGWKSQTRVCGDGSALWSQDVVYFSKI